MTDTKRPIWKSYPGP